MYTAAAQCSQPQGALALWSVDGYVFVEVGVGFEAGSPQTSNSLSLSHTHTPSLPLACALSLSLFLAFSKTKACVNQSNTLTLMLVVAPRERSMYLFKTTLTCWNSRVLRSSLCVIFETRKPVVFLFIRMFTRMFKRLMSMRIEATARARHYNILARDRGNLQLVPLWTIFFFEFGRQTRLSRFSKTNYPQLYSQIGNTRKHGFS